MPRCFAGLFWIVLCLVGAQLWARPVRGAPPILNPYVSRLRATPSPVHDIALDLNRTLLIATESGLFRLDGSNIQPTLALQFLGAGQEFSRRVVVARDGQIFVATGRAFLDRPLHPGDPLRVRERSRKAGVLRGRNAMVEDISQGLPDPWVWTLAESPKGVVWAGTEKGLAYYEKGRWQPFAENGRLPATFVSAFAWDTTGVAWVGTNAGLVWIDERHGLVDTNIDTAIMAIDVLGDGRVAVATDTHVLIFSGREKIADYVQLGVRSTVIGPDGLLWMSGDSRPVRIVDGSPVVASNLSNIQSTHRTFRDAEGSLWAASVRGSLLQISKPWVWNLLDEYADALPSYGVLASRDGAVYYTAWAGLCRIDEKGHRVYLDRSGARGSSVEPDLPVSSVRGLAEAPDGAIWIAGKEDGVVRFFPKDETATKFPWDRIAPKLTTRSMLFDDRGRLWVAHDEGVILRFDSGRPSETFARFDKQNGLCSGFPLLSGVRKAGGLWYSSVSSGYGYIDDSGAHCLRDWDGQPAPGVLAVHEDGNGNLWLGSASNDGLAVFDGRHYRKIGRESGLPSNQVHAILGDLEDKLWLGGPRGVIRVSRQALLNLGPSSVPMALTIYDQSRGMASEIVGTEQRPNMVRDPGGRVWVSTLEGVSVVPMDPPQIPLPQPSLQQFWIDGVASPWERGLTLSADVKSVRFAFVAPYFQSTEPLRFEYKLAPLRENWTASSGPFVDLSGLRPGTFTMHVRAYQVGQSPGAVLGPLRFQVMPPWWTRWWTQVGAMIVTAIALAMVHRSRVRQVEARHVLLLAERSRIARDLHDNLAQGFAAMNFLIDGLAKRVEQGSDDVQSSMGRLRDVVGQFKGEARRAVWALRGEDPISHDLAEGIESVARRSALGAEVSFEVQGTPGDLPVSHRRDIHYVVQEAVTNAVTHGRASAISVLLECDTDGIRIRIKDNGQGFPPSASESTHRSEGMGLHSMRERAERIGGSLELSTESGSPATVTLTVPKLRSQS